MHAAGVEDRLQASGTKARRSGSGMLHAETFGRINVSPSPRLFLTFRRAPLRRCSPHASLLLREQSLAPICAQGAWWP